MPFVKTLQVQVIETVLLVEPVHKAFLYGLHNDYGCIEVGLLVGLPDYPVDECAEEVAFAELNDLFRVLMRLRAVFLFRFSICVCFLLSYIQI